MPNRTMKNTTAILFITFCIGLGSAPAFAQLPDLLRPVPTSAALQQHLSERLQRFPVQTLRARPVRVDAELLKPTQTRLQPFRVQVFADTGFTAIPDRVDRLQHDAYNWIGHLQDASHGRVLLSVRGNRVLGSIRAGARLFRLQPLDDSTHAIIEIDPTSFMPEAPPDEPPGISAQEPKPEVQTAEGMIPRGPVINVLVAYTNDAADAASDIELTAQNAIADANLSYENSDVEQRLHLTGIEALDYDEPFGVGVQELRNRLRDPSDGAMDEIHALRDRQQADLVALLVSAADYCGYAYVMGNLSTDFRDFGFSATNWLCAGDNHTLAHELGHNMGARHDWFVDDTDGRPFSFNHGYTNIDDRWRTLMAYNDACDCSDEASPCPDLDQRETRNQPYCMRLTHWSNPAQTRDGDPIGVPANEDDAANNRLTLDFSASTVAAFRSLGTRGEYDHFGSSLTFGDFDADGLMDLAVGTPSSTWRPSARPGQVYIYKGTPYGLAAWQKLGQGGLGSDEIGDRFGSNLATGDFDGDGHDDLAVGAPRETPGDGPARSGWVFIYRGGSDGFSPWEVFDQQGIDFAEQGDRFGSGLAAGDVDGDGQAELAIGARGEAQDNTTASGLVSLYKGQPNSSPTPWLGLHQEL